MELTKDQERWAALAAKTRDTLFGQLRLGTATWPAGEWHFTPSVNDLRATLYNRVLEALWECERQTKAGG